MDGTQEILQLLMKQLDFLRTKIGMLTKLSDKYVNSVIYAIKLIAIDVDSMYQENVVDKLNNLIPEKYLKDELLLGLGLDTGDMNNLFYKCPFLAELFSPFSNRNLSVGVKLDISGTKMGLEQIKNKYMNLLEEGRQKFRSLTNTLTEKAMYLIYQYEMFLLNSGIFEILTTIDKIYKCLENLYEISIDPKQNLLNNVKPKLLVNNNELDIVQLANRSDVTPDSLSSVYTSYKQKVIPKFPTNSSDKLNMYKKQISNSIKMF